MTKGKKRWEKETEKAIERRKPQIAGLLSDAPLTGTADLMVFCSRLNTNYNLNLFRFCAERLKELNVPKSNNGLAFPSSLLAKTISPGSKLNFESRLSPQNRPLLSPVERRWAGSRRRWEIDHGPARKSSSPGFCLPIWRGGGADPAAHHPAHTDGDRFSAGRSSS